jgi:uncharacterized membrane protein
MKLHKEDDNNKPLSEYDLIQGKRLYEQTNYNRVILSCGFFKTTLSTGLISVGITLIFSSLTNHPMFHGWNEVGLFFGCLAIILAILLVYIIDLYKKNHKIEEYARMNRNNRELAREIASEMVEEKLKEMRDCEKRG